MAKTAKGLEINGTTYNFLIGSVQGNVADTLHSPSATDALSASKGADLNSALARIGLLSSFEFGGENMSTDGWSQDNSTTALACKIRTRDAVHLKVGDKIWLTSSGSTIRWACGWKSGDAYGASGWKTTLFECTVEGDYMIMVHDQSKNASAPLSSVEELLQYLRVERFEVLSKVAMLSDVGDVKRGTYQYHGERISFGHTFDCTLVQTLNLTGRQGFAINGNHVVSLGNGGTCSLYTYNGETLTIVGTFDLASAGSTNHANNASFGLEKASDSDIVPLLYVSQCYNGYVDGKKDVCYVEQLSASGSTLVQTINFNDTDNIFGYALLWAVDTYNHWLIAYGNSVDNTSPNNKHSVMIFNLPKLADGSEITLTKDDAIDYFVIEDIYKGILTPMIGQGQCAHYGKFYLPVGYGNTEHPSKLLVLDLITHALTHVIDMSASTSGELEDCDIYADQEMLMQTNTGRIYRLTFKD